MIETVLTTIPGKFENGRIELTEAPPHVVRARVLVTFLDAEPAERPAGSGRSLKEALAAIELLPLTEQEERILDEFPGFRERHPLDLRSLSEDGK